MCLYYNKDIVVNFEEQSFMIEHSKEEDSSSDKLKEEEEKPKPKIRKVVKKKVEIKEKEVDI